MTPCDDCGTFHCYACDVYRRQQYELELAKRLVRERTRRQAVRALIARRLAERGEPEWRPTKGIAG